MLATIIIVGLAFYWLLLESDYMRIRLPVGDVPIVELERISWQSCVSKYGSLKLSIGVTEPLCTWEWLKNNTHPIPQVDVKFESGGVRYHWKVEDCNILKNAITATHAKRKNGSKSLYKRNKQGGIVAPLPAKC